MTTSLHTKKKILAVSLTYFTTITLRTLHALYTGEVCRAEILNQHKRRRFTNIRSYCVISNQRNDFINQSGLTADFLLHSLTALWLKALVALFIPPAYQIICRSFLFDKIPLTVGLTSDTTVQYFL